MVLPAKLDAIVFCRIGSLEMRAVAGQALAPVFCRIGSLENLFLLSHAPPDVFCRIGSLEMRWPSCWRW